MAGVEGDPVRMTMLQPRGMATRCRRALPVGEMPGRVPTASHRRGLRLIVEVLLRRPRQ